MEEPKKKRNYTEITLKKIEAILEAIRKGSSVEKSCQASDLTRTTFYQWLRDDPENKKTLYEIIDSRSLVVEDALFKNALKGNTTAQIFWLKNRSAERWQDKVENINRHTGEITFKKRLFDK